MTIVAGICREGRVLLGSDAAMATSDFIAAMAGSKLVELDTLRSKLALGYTTSFRFGQILQYEVSPPTDSRNDAHEYLIRDFVPAVRTGLEGAGWLKKKDDREEIGDALIGYRGRLFALRSDLSVQETRDGLDAVGSGCAYAFGAMRAALALGVEPQRALVAGLDAAAHFNPYVLGPFDIRMVAE